MRDHIAARGRARGRVRAALATACLLAASPAAFARDGGFAPTADTDKGRVIGLHSGKVAEFRGIPYAAAPVGALRFQAPQPRAAWSQPLDATSFGSPCPQTARLGSPSLNEDCLYLNVYAPLYRDRRPVLVFIHGGSFNAGSGGVTAGGPDYRGTDITEQSDAVVVTVNYRLSILGFLASPALDAENPAGVSSNYGLQDQQEALRWVQRNIAQFGGDPGNVTIFGESAGGISVLYHLVSPGSAGLFQRAIIESGNDGASFPLKPVEVAEGPIVAALGCDPKAAAAALAACLRALPVERIVNSGLNVGPPIDGVTVPDNPRTLLASGRFNRVPVIAGTNRNEGTYFIAVAANAAGRTPTAVDYDAVIRTNFGAAAAPGIEAAYPLSAYPSPAQALAAIQTDSFFACPTDAVRRALMPYVTVLGYEFSQPNPVQNFPLPPAPANLTLGDSHTTELAYVFGHDRNGARLPTRADRVLSNHMIDYWTNFASSGDPNLELSGRGRVSLVDLVEAVVEQRAYWPRFTALSGLVQQLSTPIRPEADFADAHRCALWASLGYPQRLLTALPAVPQ